MRSLCFIVLAFFLSGCCLMPHVTLPPGERINTEEVTRIIQELGVILKFEKNLDLEDSNVFYGPYINTIQLEFSSQSLIEMCEARELIVDVVERLLSMLNTNDILGPQFANYPFSSDNLEIYINFESYYGLYIDAPGYIGWMYLEDGICFYYTFEIKNADHESWHFRREPYSKSREIVVYEREAQDKFQEVIEPPNPTAFGPERYREIENHKILHERFRGEYEDRAPK